jgi:glutamine synthetase
MVRTSQRNLWKIAELLTGGSMSNLGLKTAEDALKYIKDNNIRFLDVRFCDLPGVMQHFNVPVESVDADFFAGGQMFDGSSIRGFQSIHESDLKLACRCHNCIC